jgi:hypothetical protein
MNHGKELIMVNVGKKRSWRFPKYGTGMDALESYREY